MILFLNFIIEIIFLNHLKIRELFVEVKIMLKDIKTDLFSRGINIKKIDRYYL